MFTDFFSKKQLATTAVIFAISLVLQTVYILLNHLVPLQQDYSIVGYALGFVFILIGWMRGNHISNSYRREAHAYTGALPYEVVDKKMVVRSPFLVAGLLTLLCAVAVEFMVRIVFGIN